jgi:hypothetical protein
MDCRNGPIMTLKKDLAPILAQQFAATAELTNTDLVYCFYLAFRGGQYNRIDGGGKVTVHGITPTIIERSLRRVGWLRAGNRPVYKPMSVIDPNKFTPAARYSGKSYGPTEPEPDAMLIGSSRSEPAVPLYQIGTIHRHQSQLIAAECLSKALPPICPKKKSDGTARSKSALSNPNGKFLTVAGAVELRKKKVEAEAEATAKRAASAHAAAKAMAEAKVACADVLEGLSTQFDVTIASMKGEQLKNVLRVMGLKMSGLKHELQARIKGGWSAYNTALDTDMDMQQ